jgi:hypothetical protein
MIVQHCSVETMLFALFYFFASSSCQNDRERENFSQLLFAMLARLVGRKFISFLALAVLGLAKNLLANKKSCVAKTLNRK